MQKIKGSDISCSYWLVLIQILVQWELFQYLWIFQIDQGF